MRNNVVIVSISLTAKTPGSPLPSARQYCVVPLIFRGEPGEASISERFTRVLPETLQLGPVPRVVSVISQLLTGNHSGAEGAGPTDRRAGARSLGTQTDGEPWAIPSTQCRPEGLPTNVGKKNRKLPCLQVLRESSALHQHQACLRLRVPSPVQRSRGARQRQNFHSCQENAPRRQKRQVARPVTRSGLGTKYN